MLKNSVARAKPHLSLDAPIDVLPGVGAATLEQFGRLGIRTVRDLIRHFPSRYVDLRNPVRIAQLHDVPAARDGQQSNPEVNVIGNITRMRHLHLRGRVRAKTTATLDDGTGQLQVVWFGRPYLGTQLKPGMRVFVRGRVELTLAGAQMSASLHRILASDEEYRGELVPVYPQTVGLNNGTIRRLVRKALAAVTSDPAADLEVLPPAVLAARRFQDARSALRAIHAPATLRQAAIARRRLIFEEFFLLAASTALRRAALDAETAPDFSQVRSQAARRSFRRTVEGLVPFALTNAQERAIAEIADDMMGSAPMNRLLQGDVGSGKTAVAAAAALLALRAGYQTAFMAPTEILAAQQFARLAQTLSPAGVTTALLVGALRVQTREGILRDLRSGKLDVVVGTHALLIEDVEFGHLGLVVIDEQHRFGVAQRATLRAKARGYTPHTLVMTATPIPRTLAQSVYADLEVSVVDELPPGRSPVKTFVREESAKGKILTFIREQVGRGRQAYVVCPAVDESERALSSAVEQAEQLAKNELAGLRVALLHGRMSNREKDEVMKLFADGFINVLIATSVVEVGVDVPNASVMMVLDAHRFGLAQLHQLRGRVGRGSARSYCILVAPSGAEGVERLAILAATSDGFKIAEEDLRLRGAGDLAGTRQHGVADFRLADLIRDFPIFLEAKKEAERVVTGDPELRRPEHATLKRALASQDRDAALRLSS